jgi:hypothetical protein
VTGGAHGQIRRELDEMLAVTHRLAGPRPDVRAAAEGVRRRREEVALDRAVGEPAPAPGAAAAAERRGHRHPVGDRLRTEVDPIDAPETRRIAVGGHRHVHRAVDQREARPVELRIGVGVDLHRPARLLLAGRERQRVQPAERVGDVERAGGLVDHAGAGDAVAVELLARLRELADVGLPALEPVPVEGDHQARRRRHVVGAAGRQHLIRDPAGERHDEPPCEAGDRRGRHVPTLLPVPPTEPAPAPTRTCDRTARKRREEQSDCSGRQRTRDDPQRHDDQILT